MKSDSILIVGTGALATLFAARFAKAGISVTMLGTWAEGLTVINERGVQVEGEERAYPVRATDNPNDCKDMPFALVLVKAWQTERAAQQLDRLSPRRRRGIDAPKRTWKRYHPCRNPRKRTGQARCDHRWCNPGFTGDKLPGRRGASISRTPAQAIPDRKDDPTRLDLK